MNPAPSPITSRYPVLLRRGRAEALAVELGITANCFRDLVETGAIHRIKPTGKYAFFKRDQIVQLLS